tara:strand:+ start:1810 stop:2424 length:615 start_codon:yes stop_codon:yes gene_type:complete
MTDQMLNVEPFFTRSDGAYVFARWGRPIVPVVFGVDAPTLSVFKAAIEAIVVAADHKMDELDTELGANLMMFFCKDWSELLDVPHLDQMIPEIAPLIAKLQAGDANQYRLFRFDAQGAINACFVFLRMDAHLAEASADTLALSQAAQMILLWSDTAPSLLGEINRMTVLRPEIAGVIRAAYDPVMPSVAHDPSHALRLSARVSL